LEGGDGGQTKPRSRATKHNFRFAERFLNDLGSLDEFFVIWGFGQQIHFLETPKERQFGSQMFGIISHIIRNKRDPIQVLESFQAA
jgi:hypothetical protein